MKKKGPSRRKPKVRECPYPHKKKYTQEEARQVAGMMFRTEKISVFPYRCPVGGHSHIGHKSPFVAHKYSRK